MVASSAKISRPRLPASIGGAERAGALDERVDLGARRRRGRLAARAASEQASSCRVPMPCRAFGRDLPRRSAYKVASWPRGAMAVSRHGPSSMQIVGLERLVLRGEPLGARRGAAAALFVDRQLERLDQRAHLLPRGQVRQVRPRCRASPRRACRARSARAGRTRGTPRARKSLRSARKPSRSPSRSRHSPTSFLLREPSSARRLRTTIQSVSPPSTMRRWRRAWRTILA